MMLPQIPNFVMSQLVELRSGKPEYRADKGGQYLPGEPRRILFQGAVLPMSERDLQYMPQGTYTSDTRKLYTNRHELALGSKVMDLAAGATYTVEGELGYGEIHNMRRYILKAKKEAAYDVY